jgi:hypothetical protein
MRANPAGLRAVLLALGAAAGAASSWPAATLAEAPARAGTAVTADAFEGLVTGRVRSFMEAFGERPTIADASESTRAWIAPGGQRVERGDPGKLSLLALQRRLGVPTPYACQVVQQLCLPYRDGSPASGSRSWTVQRKGQATVAGLACDLVAVESPSARLELCVTRALGPGGIWLRQWVPHGSVVGVERALAQAGLGDFPLRVSLWQGRPQHEVEVTSITRTRVPASRLDLPAGCALLP